MEQHIIYLKLLKIFVNVPLRTYTLPPHLQRHHRVVPQPVLMVNLTVVATVLILVVVPVTLVKDVTIIETQVPVNVATAAVQIPQAPLHHVAGVKLIFVAAVMVQLSVFHHVLSKAIIQVIHVTMAVTVTVRTSELAPENVKMLVQEHHHVADGRLTCTAQHHVLTLAVHLLAVAVAEPLLLHLLLQHLL